MRQHRLHGTLLIVLLALLYGSAPTATPAGQDAEWVPMFNGRDLTGWDTFLSYQPDSGSKEILGVNKDPHGVITVVDGAIRISGEIWGALTSHRELENYHLRLEFKWGEKKWPPRDESKRDSGLLYHAVGPHGAQSDHWMRSFEAQIQEGDCGDFHSLDGVTIDIEVEIEEHDGRPRLQYKPRAPIRRGVKKRVVKHGDNEMPSGQWNTLEIIARGDKVEHIVNSQVVLRATHLSQVVDGKTVPLTKGKIQLQSEGAEVFYRNIEFKSLD
jgi:hypothetical protein